MNKLVWIAILLLALLSTVFAGSFNFTLSEPQITQENPIQWNSLNEKNSVVLRENAFESGGQFVVDFNGNDAYLFVDSFVENSFLFKANASSVKELQLTAVGGDCQAIFYQVFGSGIQRHVFSSEGKVSFSLVEGDTVFFGVIPSGVGECKVEFNDSNKFFSAFVDFKFYPPIYDFIEESLFETDSCKRTFRNEETGLEVCYDEWLAWGCSNEEFLDGSESAKLNCFVRQLNVSENKVEALQVLVADINEQTEPLLFAAFKDLERQVKEDILTEKTQSTESQNNFETLLGGVLVVLVGSVVFVYWRSGKSEDFLDGVGLIKDVELVDREPNKNLKLTQESQVSFDWNY